MGSQHPIFDADEIERKPVPKAERTEDRDEAARFIEEMWPAAATAIAEKSGYTRQHISNVLKLYFRPAGGEKAEESDDGEVTDGQTPKSEQAVELDVMKLVEIYRMGYQDGRRDERRERDGELPEADEKGMSDILSMAK